MHALDPCHNSTFPQGTQKIQWLAHNWINLFYYLNALLLWCRNLISSSWVIACQYHIFTLSCEHFFCYTHWRVVTRRVRVLCVGIARAWSACAAIRTSSTIYQTDCVLISILLGIRDRWTTKKFEVSIRRWRGWNLRGPPIGTGAKRKSHPLFRYTKWWTCNFSL